MIKVVWRGRSRPRGLAADAAPDSQGEYVLAKNYEEQDYTAKKRG